MTGLKGAFVSYDGRECPELFFWIKFKFLLLFNKFRDLGVVENFIKLSITNFNQKLDLVVIFCINVLDLADNLGSIAVAIVKCTQECSPH
jgi:hypothetical protein